jgi:hypothetical protein
LGFLIDGIVNALLMSSAGIVEFFFAMSNIERILLAASVPLATLSLSWGVRKHKRWCVLLLLGAGAGTIAAGRWLTVPGYQSGIVLVGGLFIAVAHLANRRFCQTCLECRPLGIQQRSYL